MQKNISNVLKKGKRPIGYGQIIGVALELGYEDMYKALKKIEGENE